MQGTVISDPRSRKTIAIGTGAAGKHKDETTLMNILQMFKAC